MKKRTRSTKKTTQKRTTRQSSSDQMLVLPFSFRRIILVTTALTLFLGIVVFSNRSDINKAVAGMSVTRGLFAQATISLPDVPHAVSYTVYYKKTSANEYSNTAWNIPASSKTYTLSYLRKGEDYQYKIAAVDARGAEFYWTNEQVLTNIEPM